MSFRDFLEKAYEAMNQPGLTLSLAIATVAVVVRTTIMNEPLVVSVINLMVSGVALPFLIWLLWADAPYFIFGLVSAISCLYVGHFIGHLYRKATNKTTAKFLDNGV